MRFVPYPSSFRSRRFQKTLHNLRVSVLCFLLTVLVLRNTIGAGKFGTPAQDFEELRHHFHQVSLHRKQTRVLAEVVEDMSRSDTVPVLLETTDGTHTSSEASRVLLVTPFTNSRSFCDDPAISVYHNKIISSKVEEYCRIHGFHIFDSSRSFGSNVADDSDTLDLKKLQDAMVSKPDVEWIWWMDGYTAVTDMSFEFPLSNYNGVHLILSGYVENKINPGNFLIRNSEWSLNLLQDMQSFTTNLQPGSEKSLTSSAFASYLDKYKLINSDKVHFDDSRFLSTPWMNLDMEMDVYQKRLPLPFTVDFMGCKPCTDLNACMTLMDLLLIKS